jgi:hypothetical protein
VTEDIDEVEDGISVVTVTPIVVTAVGVPASKQPNQLSEPPAIIRTSGCDIPWKINT